MKIFDDKELIKSGKKTKELIEYVNRNPKKIYETTISIVANDLGCSISTINRIVKKLGFDSYAMFKLHISNFAVKNQNNLVHENNDHFGVCCIQKEMSRNIMNDSNSTFSEKVLKDIESLAEDIYKYKSLKVLYNMKGTFLASLLRSELNALGINTVISKTEIDFNNISENSEPKSNKLALVFSETNIKTRTIKNIGRYKRSILISKKKDIKSIDFSNYIEIFHKENTYLQAFDISRYLFHLWIINLITSWIKYRIEGDKNGK